MRKTIFLLAFAILGIGVMNANPVDVETAKSLGIKFMNYSTELKTADAVLSYTACSEDGASVFYAFSLQPKGFVLVSADDRMRPILGYSTEGSFSATDMPDGLQSFERNFKAGFSQMVERKEERTDEAAEAWKRLSETGRVNNDRITRTVPYLLKSKWNQSALYNDLCPVDSIGPNNHVYAGCVATAMSQIMYYWQWPKNGDGAHTYTCYPYGDLYVNFGQAKYDYDMMTDFLDWTSSPEEIEAVAKLMYHAGVSVEMMYSPNGSGAFSQEVKGALATYFNYDTEAMYIDYRDYHVLVEWQAMLRENLDQGKPLYYSASGSDGGHAFVCDGYDENDMFHFNWGWQGFDNGYYAIDAFFLTNYDFPDGHNAIFGIYPDCSEYFFGPQDVEELQVAEIASGTNRISFVAPTQTIGEWDIVQLDSVVIKRNGEPIHVGTNIAAGSSYYFDDTEALGVNRYSVTGYSFEFEGNTLKKTVYNGPTCWMTLDLHDAAGDGWLTDAISLVDSKGRAFKRIGLTEGSDASIAVEVPSQNEIKLYWAYSIGGKDAECSFEVYDWNSSLIYASDGKPNVGYLASFVSDCEPTSVAENHSVELYPNPTNGKIQIDGLAVESVELLNTLGQIVASVRGNEIDLTSFENGVYFARIIANDGRVMIEKVIKK